MVWGDAMIIKDDKGKKTVIKFLLGFILSTRKKVVKTRKDS